MILALQLAMPYRTPLPVDSGLAPRRARPVAETALPTYSALLQTPIFAPDRAPGGGSVKGGKAAPTLDQLTVMGIAIGRGSASAVVKGPDGHSEVLKPGQAIAGWRLVGVAPSHLSFIRGAERRILTLDPRKAAGGAAAAATTQSQDDDEDDKR